MFLLTENREAIVNTFNVDAFMVEEYATNGGESTFEVLAICGNRAFTIESFDYKEQAMGKLRELMTILNK